MMAFIPHHHHLIWNMLSWGLPLEDCDVLGNVEVEDSDVIGNVEVVIGNAGEQNCRTNLPLGPQSSFWWWWWQSWLKSPYILGMVSRLPIVLLLRGTLHPTIGVYVTSRSTLFLRCFFSRMMMMVINATKTKIKAGTWRRKVIKRWRAKMTVAKTVLLQYKYNDKYNDKKDCVKKCFLGLRPISMLSSALANWCKGRGTFTDKEGIFAQLHLLWGRCCLVQERHLDGIIQLVTIYTTHRVIF